MSKKKDKKRKKRMEEELPDLGDKKRKDLICGGRGSVRLSLGLFYLNEEWDDKRKKILTMDLP